MPVDNDLFAKVAAFGIADSPLLIELNKPTGGWNSASAAGVSPLPSKLGSLAMSLAMQRASFGRQDCGVPTGRNRGCNGDRVDAERGASFWRDWRRRWKMGVALPLLALSRRAREWQQGSRRSPMLDLS